MVSLSRLESNICPNLSGDRAEASRGQLEAVLDSAGGGQSQPLGIVDKNRRGARGIGFPVSMRGEISRFEQIEKQEKKK